MTTLWKKSLFVFWPSQKNVFRPKWQKWAKNSIQVKTGIFLLNQKIWPCQKITYLAQIGFLAHFCHFGLVTFFWLGQKTKSDFFHKISTSYLLRNPFLWPEKLAAVITQTYLGRFCYSVPPWKILKHGFFEPLGGPLWPSDSLLLCTRLFIQIHSETLCLMWDMQEGAN